MRVTGILVALLVGLLSTVSFAGKTLSIPVQIDFENRGASGDTRTARHSENPYEEIGCVVRYVDSTSSELGVWKYAICVAALGEMPEDRIQCFTMNEELVDAVKSVADYAFVTFGWNETNECTRIGFSVRSVYLPASIEEKMEKNKDKQ